MVTAFGFTVSVPSNEFNVDGLIIDGGSSPMTVSDKNGGAFNLDAVGSSTFKNVTLKNLNATNNGGAIYLAAGTLRVSDSSIEGCNALNGGAIFVDGGTAHISGITKIDGNGALEGGNGAGIYVAEGAELTLADKPNFGDPAKDKGNHKAGELDNASNGQEPYTSARQDIFIAGHKGEDAPSLVVDGALEVGPGSIWVWASDEPHYEMLGQFAVFADGAREGMTADALSQTFAAFRNAQPDSATGCGGSYLTGQAGNNPVNLYWTGGFDLAFLKVKINVFQHFHMPEVLFDISDFQ